MRGGPSISLLDLVTVPALDIRGGHRRVSVLLYDARRSLSVAVHALIATVGESIDSGARETIAGGA